MAYSVSTVAFHITYYCTHACPMCYANAGQKVDAHPPIGQLLGVVNKLAEANVKEISLVGGDPASYPYIGELCKHINLKNIDISILSNTLEFQGISNNEIAKYISAFEGTIHNSIPEMHDKFCGIEGAFSKLVGNLKSFKSLGRKIGVALNITPQTSLSLYDIVYDLISKHGLNLDYIVLQRIVPMGRAENKSNFVLFQKDLDSVMKNIKRIKEELNILINIEDPFPHCLIDDEYRGYMKHRCEWGWTKVTINPKGDLSRCGADPRFLLGNIFETPLLKLWNESEILKSFRSFSYLPGKCQICDELLACGGGCPLSCGLEKDHDRDYLITKSMESGDCIIGVLRFWNATFPDLSAILQLEWANFSKYQHVFDAKTIQMWFQYNSEMFYVVKDDRSNIFGYAIVVPISEELYNEVISGKYSSLINFPMAGVISNMDSDYYHLEVIATIPGIKKSSVAGALLKGIWDITSQRAKFVTTSPMTDVGKKLTDYFGFKIVSHEEYKGEIYPIAMLEINADILQKLKIF